MKCFFSVFVSLVMVLGLVPSNLLTAVAENNKTSNQDANIKYEKVTSLDSISATDKYLIVSGNYALNNDSSSNFATKIIIDDDGTITDNFENELGSSVKWNIINKGENYQIMNGSAYLQLDSKAFMSDNSNDELVLYSDGVSFAISGTTEDKSGKLNFLRYSKGFERHQNKYSEVINESGQIFKDSSKLDIYKEVIANNSDNNGEDTGENTYNVDVNFHLDGNKDDENSSTYSVKGGDNHNVIIPESYNDHTFDYMEIDGEKYNEAVTTIESVTKDTEVNYYYDARAGHTTGSEVTENVSYFNVTMFNYGNKINDGLGNDAIFFNTGAGSPAYNHNQSGVTQGLVESELTKDGQIQFTKSQNGIFNTSPSTDLTRDVYTNVKFPFLYNDSDQSYTFDSSQYHTHSNKINGETLKLYREPQIAYDGTKKRTSFWPFNGDNDSKVDYHFGMNLGVDFYMTADGKVEGTDKDIEFEFSGDDDVWVFIDGHLVLDLGGIHDIQTGKINFASETITYGGRRLDLNGNQTVAAGSKVKFSEIHKDFSLKNLADGDTHTLQIFYLERGSGLSNCKIRFNLPTKRTLEVTKQLAEGTPITEGKFTFMVKNESGFYADKEYIIYNGNSKVGYGTTNASGELQISAGQTAKFMDPGEGDYTIEEKDSSGYETSWVAKVNGNSAGNSDTKISPTVTISKGSQGGSKKTAYTFICTNKNDIAIADDTVVLDYGKAIQFNVTNNDGLSGKSAEIAGIGALKTYDENNVSDLVGVNTELDIEGGNGSATLLKTSVGDKEIQYTPDKYMSSIDKFTYVIKYNAVGSGSETKTKYQCANVSVIPATTVYYEDNFSASNKDNANGDNGIIFTGGWKTIGSGSDNLQKGDGAYGFDSSYNSDSQDSGGSITSVSGAGFSTKATFNFTGTGFDIVGRTSFDSGMIRVNVYDKDNQKIVSKPVINEYRGEEKVLYQIPVLKVHDLDYGKYKVEIIVSGTNGLTDKKMFYLDGIRIYDPMGTDADANNKYVEDGEGYPQYLELRDKLIGSGNLDSNGSSIDSILFIDSKGQANLDEYKQTGPNNEIYLARGQKVGFKIESENNRQTVQLGAKTINGSAKIKIGVGNNTTQIELNSATDMYYDITDYLTEDGILVIESIGTNPASLTQLKTTYSKKPTTTTTLSVDKSVVDLCTSTSTLKINKVSISGQTFKINKKLTMKVSTSTDVSSLVITDKDGNKVKTEKVSVSKGKKENKFTVTIKVPSKEGEYYYNVTGLSKDKTQKSSVVKSSTIKVRKK